MKHVRQTNYKRTISIVTVCHNSIKTLAKTVSSVMAQLGVADEYILVDGGSTDGTLEYLLSLKDERITIVRNVRGGVYRAINSGIACCNNNIIGIIHSDDFYLPNTIDVVKKSFDDDIDVLFGGIWKESNDRYYYNSCEAPTSIGTVYLNHVHPAVFVKKRIYDQFRFSENYKISADLDYFYQCYKNDLSFKKVEMAFSIMASGGISDSRRWLSMIEGFSIRLKHGDYFGAISSAFLQFAKMLKRALI